MHDHDIKLCPHCHARYQTILDTCVFCSSRLHPAGITPHSAELFVVVVDTAALLLLCLVVFKNLQ